MDKYEITSIPGKVNQSGVFIGTDKASGKRVAIKLFSDVTEAQKESLLRDAKILQSFHNPNIVRILDAGIDHENNVFYVMEYLEGTPLHQIIQQKHGMSFQESWPLIEKLASALSAIHKMGVLHLDLKPGNILMVDGEPKIIDFGVLIPPEPGTFRGTPGYIAPEVILGGKPTTQSDIYSFGALLAFIWTGHKLYQGDSAENTLAHQLKNISAVLNNKDLAQVIARATKQDPSRRYATLSEMLKPLSLYNHEQEYQAEEPNEDPTQTKWGHWIIGTIVGTLIAIAIGIYYSLLHSI
jgi:serine/threonine-protein kinase